MIHFLAITAVLAAQTGGAAERCLTPDQASDLIVAVMPGSLTALAEKCRPVLPADAFLANGAGAMVERARAQMPPRERVLALFEALAGIPMPRDADMTMTVQLMDKMLSERIAADVKTSDCAAVDTLVRAMEPLPPANIGTLVSAILQLSADKPGGQGVRICKSAS